MEKSNSRESMSTSSEMSEKTSSPSKTLPNYDFSDLINDLNNLNLEGNTLMKQSQLEEAKIKFLQGKEKYENVEDKIYSSYTSKEEVDQILALYKQLLSKIAECFYEEKNYKKAIEFDLKLICFEPKNCEAIYRLFNSYSKIGKNQQAVYYGEILLELAQDNKNESKKAQNEIEKEKIKLNQIQYLRTNRINIILFNLVLIIIVLSILRLFLYKNKNN